MYIYIYVYIRLPSALSVLFFWVGLRALGLLGSVSFKVCLGQFQAGSAPESLSRTLHSLLSV